MREGRPDTWEQLALPMTLAFAYTQRRPGKWLAAFAEVGGTLVLGCVCAATPGMNAFKKDSAIMGPELLAISLVSARSSMSCVGGEWPGGEPTGMLALVRVRGWDHAVCSGVCAVEQRRRWTTHSLCMLSGCKWLKQG